MVLLPHNLGSKENSLLLAQLNEEKDIVSLGKVYFCFKAPCLSVVSIPARCPPPSLFWVPWGHL